MEIRKLQGRSAISKRLVIWSLCLLFLFPAFGSEPNPLKGKVRIIPADEVIRNSKISLYKSSYSYFLLLPGMIAFFGLSLFKKRAGPAAAVSIAVLVFLLVSSAAGSDKRIAKAVEAYEAGNYKDAVKLFSQVKEDGSDLPYLHYDLGLSYLAEHDVPSSLSELYRALRIYPGDAMIRNTVSNIEKSAGISHQYPLVPDLDPDLPLILALVVFNGACVLLGFFIRTGKNALVVFSICAFALFVTLASVAGFNVHIASEPFGIVKAEGAGWKKIPREDFGDEKKIPAGALVRVFGEANQYMLTETGEGLRGWIRVKDLTIDRGWGWNGLREDTE